MDSYINQNTARMEKILLTSARSGLSSSAVQERREADGRNYVCARERNAFLMFLLFAVRNFGFVAMSAALVVAWFFLPIVEFIICAVAYGAMLLLGFFLVFYR